MDKMRLAEDTPTKLVLEKSLVASDIWRGWSRPLIKPLLFLAGSAIVLFAGSFSLELFCVWIIFVGALIAEVFHISVLLTSSRKIIVTIDLPSKIATRFEKLIYGKETKNELALDQVSRILIHSVEEQHAPRITIWLDSKDYPPLEIVNNYDLLSFVQGTYMDSSSEDDSEKKSLDILGRKIGEFLGKPVVSKLTDYQGNTISEEIKPS